MLQAAAVNWSARWAVAYAGFLASVNYSLTTMCATDPPADPGFTAADGLAMLNPWAMDPIPFSNASNKLQQLLQRYLWYQFCQCVAAATPAPPAAPAAPVNLPDPAPGLAITNNAACDSVPWRAVTSPSMGLLTSKPIQYVVVKYTNTVTVAPGQTIQLNLNFYYNPPPGPGPGSLLLMKQFLIAPGETNTQVVPCPIGTTFVRPDFTVSGGAGTSGISYSIDGFCTSAPPGATAQSCCPPDPAMIGMLENVLGYVKLLQRQLAPFSYIAGTAHPGITGTGTFAVQGLLGMKVAVTAYPVTNRVAGGEPNYIYDLGWMSIETPDGFIDEVRVRSVAQIWQPRMMSDATRFGWYLRPGVTATFTELAREA
jgi:hypothetical protein